MNRLVRNGWLFFVAINWFLGAELHAAEVNVESLLADINRKPAEQRLKALMEGAKKEGIVYHYGSINAPDNDELTRAFANSIRSSRCAIRDWEPSRSSIAR